MLMDYAPDYRYYVSDIGRMWPVDGRYRPWQRELLQFVLDYRNAVMTRIRPGVTADAGPRRGEAGDGRRSSRARGSRSRSTRRRRASSSRRAAASSRTPSGWPSTTSAATATLLKPGQVFSIDPQLWVPEEKLYFRYEDTVVVTETGVENFTAFLPTELDALEALAREKGLVQTLPALGEAGFESLDERRTPVRAYPRRVAEHVAGPVNRPDQDRPLRVRLELAAQPRDVDVHRLRARRRILSPCAVEELETADGPTCALNQAAQELKLARRQRHGPSSLRDARIAQVHLDITEAQRRSGGRDVFGPAPQAGLDPGAELHELKRPREDVVRSGSETQHALARALGVRQQDQRAGIATPAELLADGEAVAVRERDVEQHEADAALEHAVQRLAAQGRHFDVVALLHEAVPDVEPPLCVAVYDHDVGHSSGRKLCDFGHRSLQADANPL